MNAYYRVRNGDNLGKIAQRNRVTVATAEIVERITVRPAFGRKQLIVNKKTVTVEEPQPVQQTAETTTSAKDGSGIISNYLKQQLEKSTTDETEVVTGASMEA